MNSKYNANTEYSEMLQRVKQGSKLSLTHHPENKDKKFKTRNNI